MPVKIEKPSIIEAPGSKLKLIEEYIAVCLSAFLPEIRNGELYDQRS